jgi:hypothetical protein
MWLTPLLVALLALALPAAGQAAEPGSISGTVTAKVGGLPIAGVEVCAGGEAEEAFGCATTDENGEYEIVSLPAGVYKVQFWGRPLGYADQYYAGKRLFGEATPVVVSAGAATSGIDAELERGATISGRVTAAATGLPVAGVEVCAFTLDESEFGCEATDGTGAYAIEGLASGQYEVYFYTGETEGELVSQPYELGLITLTTGQVRTGVDAALKVGGQISGTVRLAATGAPLKGVEVCITEATETWPLGCLKTPASGAYRFTGLWNSSFKVVFSPEASELEEGQELGIVPDAFPTQWWNGQPTFAAATPIAITPPAVVGGIDASLGPGPVVTSPPVAAAPSPAPAPSSPPTAVVVKPKPKPLLKCKRGFVKKTVKGKPARCVKRHKPKKHHRNHHRRPHKHVARAR